MTSASRAREHLPRVGGSGNARPRTPPKWSPLDAASSSMIGRKAVQSVSGQRAAPATGGTAERPGDAALDEDIARLDDLAATAGSVRGRTNLRSSLGGHYRRADGDSTGLAAPCFGGYGWRGLHE
jgi:hypothetical protein